MQRSHLFAIAGGLSFLLFLTINAPARLLQGPLAASGIQTAHIQGTLWQGRIPSSSLQGLLLTDTTWDLNPLALLLGRFSTRFETYYPGGLASGHLALGFGGSISLSDTALEGTLAPLARLLNLPLAGMYEGRLEKVRIKDNWPQVMQGNVRLTGIPIDQSADSDAPRSNFIVEFNHEASEAGEPLVADIVDDGGPLDVQGEIILRPPAAYVLQLNVGIRPGASPSLAKALELTAPLGPDGRRQVSLAGSF